MNGAVRIARFSGLIVATARMQIRRVAGNPHEGSPLAFLRRRVMPNNVYSEIHLHFTWHVKTDAAIDPAFEAKLQGFIRDYASRMQGVIVGPVAHGDSRSPYLVQCASATRALRATASS